MNPKKELKRRIKLRLQKDSSNKIHYKKKHLPNEMLFLFLHNDTPLAIGKIKIY